MKYGMVQKRNVNNEAVYVEACVETCTAGLDFYSEFENHLECKKPSSS